MRDRYTMLIILAMPVVQIVLFGFAITTEVKDVRTAILEPSNDAGARRVTDRIAASEYFDITGILHSPEEMERAFVRNDIDMALVFPDNYSSELLRGEGGVQIVADATDPNLAVTRSSYAAAIIGEAQAEEAGAVPAGGVAVSSRLLYNPQMRSAYNFVPGVMGLILMLICAMMTSISIVREKETGTMEVLLVSPVRPLFVIISKTVPYFVLSVINLVTILLLSRFVIGVPVAGSVTALFAVSFLFIFVSLALGILISSITHTQVAAMLASGMVLMMPTLLLSGMIFPIESMPAVLQWVSAALPARWYIDLVRKIMIQGVDVMMVWEEVLVLAVMALVLVTVSVRLFKNRL